MTVLTAWSEVCFLSKWWYWISHVCCKSKVMIKRVSLFWSRQSKLWFDQIKCFWRPMSTISMHVRALKDWILTKIAKQTQFSLLWSFVFLIINLVYNNNNKPLCWSDNRRFCIQLEHSLLWIWLICYFGLRLNSYLANRNPSLWGKRWLVGIIS